MRSYALGHSINKLVHGCDYHPDQWLDRPDILSKDIEYMKEAGINYVYQTVYELTYSCLIRLLGE